MAVDLPRRLPALIATAAAHGWRGEILTSRAMDGSYRVLTVTWSLDGTAVELSWTRDRFSWLLAAAEVTDGTGTYRLRVRDVPGLLTGGN